MKFTTTTLEHCTRSIQSPTTSAFGGGSVTIDLLAPGGSTCSCAGSSSSCSKCAVASVVKH
ncbi:hypothetical protein FD512_06990 [Cutibacterium acnes]|nr:hypothetical protein FD512_06990 [Cutibacterium acnes]TMT64730.1 hypothetical protein DMX94_07005 [Cutibacterium acnes]